MFVPVLYWYTYNDKQAHTVFHKFTMANKHEVLGSKAREQNQTLQLHQQKMLRNKAKFQQKSITNAEV